MLVAKIYCLIVYSIICTLVDAQYCNDNVDNYNDIAYELKNISQSSPLSSPLSTSAPSSESYLSDINDEIKDYSTTIEPKTFEEYKQLLEWGSIENISSDNTSFQWNIPKFSEFLEDKDLSVIKSPRFYVKRSGHRIQLIVNPSVTYNNGDVYLGVYFRLVTGLMDHIILWPYENITILTLVNQINPNNSYNYIINPNINECKWHSVFLRPSLEADLDRNPKVCGNSKMISMKELQKLKNQLLIDDTLKIQIRFTSLISDNYNTSIVTMEYNQLISRYIWTIDNFNDTLNLSMNSGNITILSSRPFYTYNSGYLMAIYMILLPKRKAFALSVVLIPGDFDRYLQWPFPYNFKISIMDQNPEYWRRDFSILIDPSSANCGTLPFYAPSLIPDYCFITIQSISLLQLTHYKFIIDGKLKIIFTTLLSTVAIPSSSIGSSSSSDRCSLSMYNGSLVSEYSWLLINIAQKMYRFDYTSRKVKVFTSRNFYTNGQGYLMQLILKLNITKDNNGTIDLGLAILEGNYDHLLQWPFNNTFELIIINLRDTKDNINGFNQTEIVSNLTSTASSSSTTFSSTLSSQTPAESFSSSSKIVIKIVPNDKSHQCPSSSFMRPIKSNTPCGKKNIISFRRINRSHNNPIKIDNLLIKIRIYL